MLEPVAIAHFDQIVPGDDTHWLHRGGMTPAYVSEFKDRILIFHLKDYRVGLLRQGK